MDSGKHRSRHTLISRVRYAVLGCLFLAALAFSPFRTLKITGDSMYPTFRDGETYLLDLFYWKLTGVRRWDIVVLKHDGEQWVKRLVGMPGDELQIHRNNDGWITSVQNLTENPNLKRDTMVEYRRVLPGEIFIVGDNLNRSFDSTVQEAGVFRVRDIIGVVRSFTLSRTFPYRYRAGADVNPLPAGAGP